MPLSKSISTGQGGFPFVPPFSQAGMVAREELLARHIPQSAQPLARKGTKIEPAIPSRQGRKNTV